MCACKTLIDPGHNTEVTVKEPEGAAVQPTSDGLRYLMSCSCIFWYVQVSLDIAGGTSVCSERAIPNRLPPGRGVAHHVVNAARSTVLVVSRCGTRATANLSLKL